MARPLLIGDIEKAAIKNLIFYAENNKIPLKKMKKIMAGELSPAEDNPNYAIILPVDFRVVFTIERHPKEWFKHLSISVPGKGRLPHPHAVYMICKEFGIENFKDEYIYKEDEVEAINIISKYKEAK